MNSTPIDQDAHYCKPADLFLSNERMRNAILQAYEHHRTHRDDHYLQFVTIWGRSPVSKFWRAPIDLNLHRVGFENENDSLRLVGLGPWFNPVMSCHCMAGCIVPADAIERETSHPSVFNFHPLNAVADWLRTVRP